MELLSFPGAQALGFEVRGVGAWKERYCALLPTILGLSGFYIIKLLATSPAPETLSPRSLVAFLALLRVCVCVWDLLPDF